MPPDPPSELASQAVAAFHDQHLRQVCLPELHAWLVVDGWDLVYGAWEALNAPLTVNLHYLQYSFSDSEIDELDLDDDGIIRDSDRVAYIRKSVAKCVEDGLGFESASLHPVELRDAQGRCVTVGCMVAVMGQAGPYLECEGLFENRDEFCAWARTRHIFRTEEIDAMTEADLLAYWRPDSIFTSD